MNNLSYLSFAMTSCRSVILSALFWTAVAHRRASKRRALQRTHVVGAGKTAPHLVFWHLEKAGGRLATSLINDAMGGRGGFTTIHEWGVYTPTQERRFVVAPMREPCSYYVSEFNWGVSGKGFLRRALLANVSSRERIARWYADGQNSDLAIARAAFRAWVTFINGADGGVRADETCGLLGARLWAAVLDPVAGLRINRRNCNRADVKAIEQGRGCSCPLLDCMRQAQNTTRRACRTRVRGFGSELDVRTRDICWIRTEHLVEDLAMCLAAFREAGGRVNPDFRASMHWKVQATDSAFYSHGQTSQDRLWTCADLVDPHSGAIIYGYEGEIAARFNMTCCTRL